MMIEKIIAGNEKAMDFEPQMVDYPTNLGFPCPLLAGHYEVAISGKQNERREAVPQILKIFEISGASVVSLSFYNDQSMDQFVMNVVCDLTSAKCTQDELLIRVNKSKFVKIAEMSPLEGKIFSRFAFPLTFFSEIRALAIDTDRFVRLFDDLIKTFGSKAKDSLYENGRKEGAEIIEALKEKLGERWSNDRLVLVENARVLIQTAGWGKVVFQNEGAEIYKVIITDPPSDADGSSILKNYFLHGMIAGVLESFLKGGIRLSMIREGYEADKNGLLLYYMDKAAIKELATEDDDETREVQNAEVIEKEVVNPTTPKQDPVERPKQREIRRDAEVAAATEVSQIIKSIEDIKGGGEKEETIAAEISETSPPGKAIQGEMVGFGVQIVSQPTKKPSSRERKKNSSQENQREYSSTDTVQL